MKRRNAEIGKMRRPVKKTKITEGFYGSTLLYLKFLIVWILVILADFILEFRFEFLWPFYLLLRSVYDSFKYQGLAFSLFFVCIALTSDMLCFFFIPVHWLFFAASTYVWVQYVWHTERGVCTPTVVLWVIFVYVEAGVRLRDIKHWPGHLDLCRPFAAHCIGYPVVTLGFGFKSYVGMRQRKQRDVAKENDFYMQLMHQALPPDAVAPPPPPPPVVTTVPKVPQNNNNTKNGHITNGHIPNGIKATAHHRKTIDKCKDHDKHSHTNGTAIVTEEVTSEHEPVRTRRREKVDSKEREAQEYLQKLEADARRLRGELQSCRVSEQELRLQVAALTTSEKVSKGELSTMQREIEDLQQRYQSAISSRSSDKQAISNLERRMADERRSRCSLESQLNQERKSRKQEEARAAQVAAQSSRGECTEACRARRRELEAEIAECRSTQRWAEDRYAAFERENSALVEQLRDRDVLMTALTALQEKNSHLENSLSAETRIKLDLFSALGEAKRQLEIRESSNRTQEREIEELKSKIAQVLAVMPTDSFGSTATTSSAQMSRVRLAEVSPNSTLDPNATAYTPKSSLVASTEA